MFPKEAQLAPDDVYVLTKLAIMEYLTSGITMMFDMYFARESIASAAVDTGFRAALVGCANDFGGTAQETADEYAKFSNYHPLISYRLGFHAEYTTSEPLLRDLSEGSPAPNRPGPTGRPRGRPGARGRTRSPVHQSEIGHPVTLPLHLTCILTHPNDSPFLPICAYFAL